VRVAHGADGRLDDLGAVQDAAQRDHHMPGLEVAGGRLGEQRPAGHVRPRVADHHRRLARAQQPFQAHRGAHPARAATGDQDPWSAAHHFLQPSLVKTILSCKYFAAADAGASPPGSGTPATGQARPGGGASGGTGAARPPGAGTGAARMNQDASGGLGRLAIRCRLAEPARSRAPARVAGRSGRSVRRMIFF
jgi:hypothetical protein